MITGSVKTGGYFDEENREYVITSPILPSRWINYIGTNLFGGFVDHNGGAALCKEDPAFNRITRYLPQAPSSQVNGMTCYIRQKNGDDYRLFSPYYSPVCIPLDKWECRVGLSYSKFLAEKEGLHIEITVFVPKNSNRLVHHYKVTNQSESVKKIDIIPVIEYSHFDALKNITNRDWVGQTMQSRLIAGPSGIRMLSQSAFMKKDSGFNYFCSNPGFSSFESGRDNFLGNYSYGTWQNPASLQSEKLSNTEILGGENIGALLIECEPLAPGETTELITQIGQSGNMDAEWEKIAFYSDTANVKNCFEEIAADWDTRLTAFHVSAPDKAFSLMANTLLPRQCSITVTWSRDLSSYQTGFGDRGTGFRDACQDSTGIAAHDPEGAKEMLSRLASMQCEDGHAMHQYNRLTLEAAEGDSREHPDRPSFYSDDHLWLIIAVTKYLKETGDMDFLSEEISFYSKGQDATSRKSAPLLEHLKRALLFTEKNTGKHGIPLLGFADWNDTVNLPAGSESVFSACLYGKALDEMIELYEFLGESEAARDCGRMYQTMKNVVNTHAWDGAWYIAYFDAAGNPVGSSKNTYGKIFGHVQSWAVISGFADGDRAQITLDSVKKYLDTPYGVKLSYPGYSGYDPELGGVSTYPPGAKENGGIFCHAHSWMIIAEALCGNGTRAFELFSKTNPLAKNDSIDVYEMEPYCMSQNILGDEHPHAGRARNSWLTGTAAWTYRAAAEYIIGIRPNYRELVFDPCIPASWDTIQVNRTFRGKHFEISISNPDHVQKGKTTLVEQDETRFQVIMKGKG